MPSYNRLALVACKDPRSVRVVLTGSERKVRVSALGPEEWVEIEMGLNGSAQFRARFSTEGDHDIPSGFGWIDVAKAGSGSPTTVELIHDA